MQFKLEVKKLWQIVSFVILLALNIFVLSFILKYKPVTNTQEVAGQTIENKNTNIEEHYGFSTDQFQVSKLKLKANQLLPDLFSDFGFKSNSVQSILSSLKEHIDFRSMRAGTEMAFVSQDLCDKPQFFVYNLNKTQYIVADLNNDGCCTLVEKKSEVKSEAVLGQISSSLWDAMQDQGVPNGIIDQMEDALSSSMDFHQVQVGNTFKLIYDRLYIEGEGTNEGQLKAAMFKTENNEYFAYSFEHQGKTDFYDEQGRPMRKFFLKAPVRFSRISSPFSAKRFHPVLKYHRPHLGTDYAAPYGTPIIAVGSGTVEAAAYGGGNGKFVKIRHDKTYQTQYLHMSRFAEGIRTGAHVNQGQVIGYVGSTGLATGPHVCFRFWKNGQQVDHRKLNFPAQDPLPSNVLPQYNEVKNSLRKQLDAIQQATAMLKS